jgi:hypothetical protein
VPALALSVGCGGGDDSGLSSRDKLDALHARAFVAEYCAVHKGGPNALTDRALPVFLEGVEELARLYRAHPDAEFEIPAEKKSYTMQTLLEEQIRLMRKCGRYGRQQAGVLQVALQQQQT